jgi:hypothetical protein
MKKLALLAIWLALPLTACKTVTASLPNWAPTQPVAAAGYAIASANAAVTQYEADVKNGFVPSPTLRTVMSDLQQALAVAQPIFDQWELAARANASAAEPAVLPAQILRITNDLGQLTATAAN